MKRAVFALLLVVVAIACEQPGPLPAIPGTGRGQQIDLKKYWFPTDSITPLSLDTALQDGDLAEVRRLLDHGANPNWRWSESGDHFPLQESIESIARGYQASHALEAVSLLLRHGADPNARWCLS